MLPSHLLSWMIFLPLGGAAVIAVLPARRHEVIKTVAACTAALPLVMGLVLLLRFDHEAAGFQFVEHYTWVPAFTIEYFVGVDGLGLPLVLLAVVLAFLGLIGSWNVDHGVKGFCALFLVVEMGLVGAFCALDVLLWFVFWEVVLVAVFFLAVLWGGADREPAAHRYLIVTQAGAAALLIVLVALRQHVVHPDTGLPTSNLLLLMDQANHDSWLSLVVVRRWLWLGLLLGCGVLLPLFPLHVWQPAFYAQAPASVSLLVAGIVSKLGVFGLVRLGYTVLPDATAWAAPAVVIIGVVSIVYGGFCALAAGDLSRVAAYASLSLMGYVVVGFASISVEGLHGAMALAVSHGLVMAMIFLTVSGLRDRAGHADLVRWGGLYRRAPVLAVFFTGAVLGAMGLPGLAVFPGQVLVLLGALPGQPLAAVAAGAGLVLGAAWAARVLVQVCLREPPAELGETPTIRGPELVVMIPLSALVLGLGLYPQPLVGLGRATLEALIKLVGG